MIEAFKTLSLEALLDYQRMLDKTEAPPEKYLDPADIQQRAQHLGECGWEHFRHHAQMKFRLALIELVHESLAFTGEIYTRRCGATEEEINEARPTHEDIQHNVLRHAVIRLNQLPLRKSPESWFNDEADSEDRNMQFRVARLIFKDLSLWTYDHTAVSIMFQQLILPFLETHESPDEEAALWGNESAELIWEHIDGAVQVMLLILVNWVLLLSKHSAVKRHEVELNTKQAKQIKPSKEQLKDIAETLISSWIDGLPFDWRGSGRPVKKSNEIDVARELLSHELHEIAAAITADGERVTWEALAMRRKRPLDKPQSGESLRKEAAALNLPLNEFKPEEN